MSSIERVVVNSLVTSKPKSKTPSFFRVISITAPYKFTDFGANTPVIAEKASKTISSLPNLMPEPVRASENFTPSKTNFG